MNNKVTILITCIILRCASAMAGPAACSSPGDIPADEKLKIKICKEACDKNVGYACFQMGLLLEESDKSGSVSAYRNACDLKEARACNFLTSRHPDQIPKLKSDCNEKSNMMACALYASSLSRPRGEKPNEEQLNYSRRACEKNNGYGCLIAALYFVGQMDPNSSSSVSKRGNSALPYARKACGLGWQIACDLTK